MNLHTGLDSVGVSSTLPLVVTEEEIRFSGNMVWPVWLLLKLYFWHFYSPCRRARRWAEEQEEKAEEEHLLSVNCVSCT